MASLFSKAKTTKGSAPKKTGRSLFSGTGKNSPPKTSVYKKDVLDPSKYADLGFGDTGLMETPSILGMARTMKK